MLISKDKSKDSKAPNKKFYNKSKKNKRPSRIVLMTKEEYSSDEVDSSSDEEEISKEVSAIATTNIPSSSLFESPNENPHIKNAHYFMTRSSLDTSIVLSTQEEYTSGDDDDDDDEDQNSNGLVALASLSNNSSSPTESPNEDIQMKEESCLMAKSSEVSSPNPSMPNISNALGIDHASLKMKQEMLDFDEFILNLKGDTKKHVSALMIRLAQLDDTLDKKCQIEREDSLEIAALKNALEEGQETIASLEERLETLEAPQDETAKLTKERDHARAKKVKVLKEETAKFGIDHEKLVKDLDELDKAHKALKSEHSLLSKSNEQLQIMLAKYDLPSSSTPSCDHANLIEENARLKDELAKTHSGAPPATLERVGDPVLGACELLLASLFLLFFAGFRKRYRSSMLRMLLWLVYLSADTVAVFVLGRLTRVAGDDPLVLFWAPFMLLHLGGQETITAFSMEDCALWKRHLLNLTTQVALAIYVLGKQWQGEKQLVAPMVLIFISGMAKYVERIWILGRAGSWAPGSMP
ncbi:hypothetical protein QYE76_010976 [Lolium multiflorum]|uniref:DUF4220 domain-containing protein n=1 Tax=Lolium multiflorum TaxID=4521 RepID=A0AAD8X567_LOLMU|nr:hypothetical protein QYE76_010976 [Lolium multiflorum]